MLDDRGNQMSLDELKAELVKTEEAYERADERRDELKSAISKYGVDHNQIGPVHTCTIWARSCETTRDCNCLYGQDHTEYETPLMWNGKRF